MFIKTYSRSHSLSQSFLPPTKVGRCLLLGLQLRGKSRKWGRWPRLGAPRPRDVTSLPYENYKRSLGHLLTWKWQSDLNEQKHNNLHLIIPILKQCERARYRERFYEGVVCRFRVEHTHLTYGHLLLGLVPPFAMRVESFWLHSIFW